jgi:energy-coupling factor transporter ATP-binding protein EcfA2
VSKTLDEIGLSTTGERRAVTTTAGAAPTHDWVIVTRQLKREYDMGGEIVRALRGVDLAIRRNEYVAIMGPSGSGKSTLMNLIGCLDTPNEGEYWLNGMLVSEMSDDALARVRKGEDFAKVAAELSRDPGSGKDGGDLGYFTQDRMVPQFGAVAFQLKAGDVSEPVQTQFGWHVIKVEDKRSKPLPKFEDVKGEIETYLVRKAQQDIVMGLGVPLHDHVPGRG